MADNAHNLFFKTKTTSLFILAVTAVVLSRIPFFLLNDPEGPNALIVLMLSLIVWGLSSLLYIFVLAKLRGVKGLVAGVAAQAVLIAVLYFLMK